MVGESGFLSVDLWIDGSLQSMYSESRNFVNPILLAGKPRFVLSSCESYFTSKSFFLSPKLPAVSL